MNFKTTRQNLYLMVKSYLFKIKREATKEGDRIDIARYENLCKWKLPFFELDKLSLSRIERIKLAYGESA